MVSIHLVYMELLHHSQHAGMYGPRVFATKGMAEAWAAEMLYQEFGMERFHKDQLLDWQLNVSDFELMGEHYAIPEHKRDNYEFMSAFLNAIWEEDMPLDAEVTFEVQELEFPPSLEEEEPPKKKV